ncbi:uncharacterized protein SPPG_09212 [Spizellomyces punctatus DAOM BR117]|uniref:ATPase of the ABC class n=1 Tax=Spizellomyces punctatus (strain DAOM BR117) TaxID=645134 RepID=A0A0L0HGV8_SPIPD|nr:uncharacterized protein SPPG_09212 [Spizellomyces punctatus DAOM BR117]KND00312.1 hypothetical protein SPPG_09212 [Spizellomyces punctatus DAOM BR117]|eukprot:XP_016608351.1 hypothetical protein SPPG_09212 [Spizellomyces punctatus DAOM BR117]
MQGTRYSPYSNVPAGSSRGRGRGRGAYFKEKYGGGRSRELREERSGRDTPPTEVMNNSEGNCPVRTMRELASYLISIDRGSYGQYKGIKGYFAFDDGMQLFVDNVQSDPFAPPSKFRVRIPQESARFPADLFRTPVRRVALEDYITRQISTHVRSNKLHTPSNAGGGGWHGPKGADINIDTPGQQVLERTSLSITPAFVEARLTIGLPAQGRSILGRQACTLLTEVLPSLAAQTMRYAALDEQELRQFVESVEDQHTLRQLVKDAGLVSFVRNGAILPRESGASDRPMRGADVIPFVSPDSLRRVFTLPNRGVVEGMGVPRGITLIVGGGFHGKSTLLDALQVGIYNHIPGDGREFVVTDESVMKIRAEDGRSVTSVDISPFINNLPFEKDTTHFSTPDASGSTSMAANMQEALEIGCRGFLFDEDTCATNFLIRDRRMELLVSKENEPITPLISKIRSLYTEKGCSSILVVGGCGSYLDVADVVISMESYVPRDVTRKAKKIAADLPVALENGDLPYGPITDRIIVPKSHANNVPVQHDWHSEKGASEDSPLPQQRRSGKSKAIHTFLISLDGVDVNLSALEQLAHPSQARCIVDAALYVRDKMQGESRLTLKELVAALEREWDEKGIDCVHPFAWPVGNYARPRGLEVAGALNRLRGLVVE